MSGARVRMWVVSAVVAAMGVACGDSGSEPEPTSGGTARSGSTTAPPANTDEPPAPSGTGVAPAQPALRRVDPRSGGFTMGMGEWALAPETRALRPGRVTFVIRNSGQAQHGFEIKAEGGGGDDRFEAQSRVLAPGQTVRFSANLAAGIYEIECYVAEHDALGMQGTLVVRPDAPLVRQRRGGGGTVEITGLPMRRPRSGCRRPTRSRGGTATRRRTRSLPTTAASTRASSRAARRTGAGPTVRHVRARLRRPPEHERVGHGPAVTARPAASTAGRPAAQSQIASQSRASVAASRFHRGGSGLPPRTPLILVHGSDRRGARPADGRSGEGECIPVDGDRQARERLAVAREKRTRVGVPAPHVERAAEHDRAVSVEPADAARRCEVDRLAARAELLGHRRGDLGGGAALGRIRDQDPVLHDVLLTAPARRAGARFHPEPRPRPGRRHR
jgi:plastocyanin